MVTDATVGLLTRCSMRLDAQLPALALLDAYYAGKSPVSYLSPKAYEQLGGRLRGLQVNFQRLAVLSLVERLSVIGFRTSSDGPPDVDLWQAWTDAGMVEASDEAHTEVLALGRAFVIVWADPRGHPTISVESARQVVVERDPMTRQVTGAVKRFFRAEGADQRRAYAYVFTPTEVTQFRSTALTPWDTTAPATGLVPVGGWEQVGDATGESLPNPFGVVPVVPLVNRGRLLDVDGVSEMADLLDLSDALNKVSLDSLITSEFLSQPRRWATGLEIVEETDPETGEPVAVNPFAVEGPERVMQSEAPDTKFGQFAAADLSGYRSLVDTLTGQIAALAGLPPSYVGINSANPTSADAIRAAEAGLIARAVQKQRWLSQPWAEVMRLVLAVQSGRPPSSFRVETVWADPSTRSTAAAADAASKLVGAGLLSRAAGLEALGYEPEAVDRITNELRGEQP